MFIPARTDIRDAILRCLLREGGSAKQADVRRLIAADFRSRIGSSFNESDSKVAPVLAREVSSVIIELEGEGYITQHDHGLIRITHTGRHKAFEVPALRDAIDSEFDELPSGALLLIALRAVTRAIIAVAYRPLWATKVYVVPSLELAECISRVLQARPAIDDIGQYYLMSERLVALNHPEGENSFFRSVGGGLLSLMGAIAPYLSRKSQDRPDIVRVHVIEAINRVDEAVAAIDRADVRERVVELRHELLFDIRLLSRITTEDPHLEITSSTCGDLFNVHPVRNRELQPANESDVGTGIVLELEVPDDADDASVIATASDLVLQMDRVHRAFGGRGLQVRDVDVRYSVQSPVGARP